MKGLLARLDTESMIIGGAYLGVLMTSLAVFIPHVHGLFRQGESVVVALIIYLYFLGLSIVSFVFYQNFVSRIQDTAFGTGYSILAVVVLLALAMIGVFWKIYVPLGIGTLVVCGKVFQLRYRCKQFEMSGLKLSVRYLFVCSLFYFAFFLITTATALTVDLGAVPILGVESVPNELTQLEGEVSQLKPSPDAQARIDTLVGGLSDRFENLQEGYRSVVASILVILFPTIFYCLYRIFLFLTKIDPLKVRTELEGFQWPQP